ncbi:MAG: hypothetical protein ACREMM_07735 [Gemmatimonadales bacterium]
MFPMFDGAPATAAKVTLCKVPALFHVQVTDPVRAMVTLFGLKKLFPIDTAAVVGAVTAFTVKSRGDPV